MRILLADDHPLFRAGVIPVLEKLDPKVEVLEAVDFPAAFLAMSRAGEVDLVLMDLTMPGMAGLEGVMRFRDTFPDTPLVVLSAAENVDDIQRVLAAGALGYLTKATPGEAILAALRQVLDGGVYLPPILSEDGEDSKVPAFGNPYSQLSDRQLQVLGKLVQGLSNRQIGEALAVTEGTIKVHMGAIFRVLKVTNRTEAVLLAQKMGLPPPD